LGLLLKISGAGNRFILADRRWFKPEESNTEDLKKDWEGFSYPSPLPFDDFKALSQKDLLERKKTLDLLLSKPPLALADGLIVLKDLYAEPLIFDFYNKDGSQAEMCGNAACCLSYYLNRLGLNVKEFYLGKQKVFLDSKGSVVLEKPTKNILYKTEPFPYYFIDTGVPHGVVTCDELIFPSHNSPGGDSLSHNSPAGVPSSNNSSADKSSFDNPGDGSSFENTEKLKEKAQALRFKNIEPYKEGMNVSFYQALLDNHLKAVTFERGVEDFTLACGTGALAVSLIHSYKNQNSLLKKQSLYSKIKALIKQPKKNNLIKVEMPGGVLTVEIGDRLKLSSQVKQGF